MYNQNDTPTESPTAKRRALLKGRKIMFPNWTGWLYVKAALFSLVTIDAVFMTADVFSVQVMTYAKIVALFLGAFGVIVTTLSGTAASSPALAKVAARKLAMAAAKMTSLLAFCFWVGSLWACQACSPSTGQQVVSSIPPTVETVVCIISTYAQDESTGMGAVAIVADVVNKCNTDATTVVSIWAAHVHAEAIDPTPKPAPVVSPDGGVMGTSPNLNFMFHHRMLRGPMFVGGDK